MLYIFLVDNGTMMQFDMNLALETVGYLKAVISRSCRISPEKQILLISGGESLDDDHERVCKYTAGTDTNPIFLFSMTTIENPDPPDVPSEFDLHHRDEELMGKVESSFHLPDTQNTVAIRAVLAQEYVESSKEQSKSCETLIHDQHLQHQGWSAVVANLEDTATALSKRADKLEESYKTYLNNREKYKGVIDAFDDDIALLHQIPVFPELLKSSNDKSMVGSIIPAKEPYILGQPVTLLEWINDRGSNQSLEQVADSCYRTLTQMDQDLIVKLRNNVSSALEGAKNSQMKEIGGLGDRLSQLEQLSLEAKRMVQEQSDLAKAFVQNQQRASNLKDPSILPDLCASHRQQLLVMTKNFQNVVSIRKRCSNAKSELSANLHSRLKWIVFIQNKIADAAQSVLMNFEILRRLSKKLEVIEQIHMAPSMYMATAVEVVRRKAFSKRYIQKTADLSLKFSSLYNDEIALRQDFQSRLKKHFIYRMFPGLEDMPPPFATKQPPCFDENLPNITIEDVEELRTKFPELANDLDLPNERALFNLLTRSFSDKLTIEDGEARHSLQTMTRKLALNNRQEWKAMSTMHTLVADNMNGRRNNKYHFDTDTDDEDVNDEDKSKNGKKFRSKKLTRSLPLETSSITTDATKKQQINGTTSSSSGADPSTSRSSTAPSSSSDGSLTKPEIVSHQLNRIKDSVQSRLLPSLTELKNEFNGTKVFVQDRMAEYEGEISTIKTEILENFANANESLLKKLEVERNKVEDYAREVEMYRQQLSEAMMTMNTLKGDLVEENQRREKEIREIRAEAEDERREYFQRMTLIHELELDTLRQKLENFENYGDLEAELQARKEECEILKRKIKSLETTREEEFHSEKDKIVAILETGFLQREKLAVQKKEEELIKDWETKLHSAEVEHETVCLKLREELAKDLELKLNDQREETRAEYETELEKERRIWETEKQKEIKDEVDKIKTKSKREIDGLRARFKIMHAAGALERSPSASESEISLESPRVELIEQIRSAMATENENNLLAERNKWEIRSQQMAAEHKEQLDQLKAKKQIIFNEALQKVVEEKDAKIRELVAENERLKNTEGSSNNENLEMQLSTLSRRNEELQSELNDLMSRSISNDVEKTSISQLGAESLKSLLKISVTTADIGDIVMIEWDEEHNQYSIYNKRSTHFHFLHSDSYKDFQFDGAGGKPNKFTTGVVIDKEYCMAKKAGNKFNLPPGSKFYRVKCKPTNNPATAHQ